VLELQSGDGSLVSNPHCVKNCTVIENYKEYSENQYYLLTWCRKSGVTSWKLQWNSFGKRSWGCLKVIRSWGCLKVLEMSLIWFPKRQWSPLPNITGYQGRFYVVTGGTCPPDSLVAVSDSVPFWHYFWGPKMLQSPNFPGPPWTPLGSLQHYPRTPSDKEEARCPLPRTPPPLRPSGLVSMGLRV